MTTKFFKAIDEQGFYTLYVCDANTPIPTMKEIIERQNLSPYCESDMVKEITKEEFLFLHDALLTELSDSADDMMEWAPNGGHLATWEWWYSEKELEEWYRD